MCNKVSYESKSDALKDAKLIRVNNKRYSNNRLGLDKASKLKAYQCPMCDKWHLTSLARNVTRSWGK